MERLKRFLMSMTLIFASTIMYAQEITGTVVDATGEAVIGATVMEKGTSNGTITDFDGNFKLKVSEGATLVFSYNDARQCKGTGRSGGGRLSDSA